MEYCNVRQLVVIKLINNSNNNAHLLQYKGAGLYSCIAVTRHNY